MEELFVPYEIAKQLKEKGFNEQCLAHYKRNKNLRLGLSSNAWGEEFGENEESNWANMEFVAPVYQQVTNWLIEKHKILIQPQPNSTEHKVIGWNFGILKESTLPNINQAIEKALKLI